MLLGQASATEKRRLSYGSLSLGGRMIDTTRLLCWALSFSILVQGAPALAAGGTVAVDPAHHGTRTPIRHLIVVIGENRSFDNVFGTYVPTGNQTIWNLRSRGIVKPDG